MTERQEAPDEGLVGRDPLRAAQEPRLAEDVLLLLFQPTSNSIAGEGTLFYVLAGAVVADLALHGQVEERRSGRSSSRVHALGAAPEDDILRTAWDYLSKKPRSVHSVVAAVGPGLRGPLLDRLIEHGHVRRWRRGCWASSRRPRWSSRGADEPSSWLRSGRPSWTGRSLPRALLLSLRCCGRVAPFPSSIPRSRGPHRSSSGPTSSRGATGPQPRWRTL